MLKYTASVLETCNMAPRRSVWGARGARQQDIPIFAGPSGVRTRLEAQSASFLIMSGRTLTCKPRYKRRAGKLNAYWIFCLRLKGVYRCRSESGGKDA
jgi:hypothetical protein